MSNNQISNHLDIIRDKYNIELTDDERTALIKAANILRENISKK